MASGLLDYMALGTILKETGLPVATSSTSTSTSRTAGHGTICHGTPTTSGKRAAAELPYVHPRIIKDFVGWVRDRGVIIPVQRLVLPLAMTK